MKFRAKNPKGGPNVLGVLVAIGLGGAAAATSAIANQPPQRYTQPGARTVQFPTGLYDDAADGATLIRNASERAKADGKRVLVIWGENNCGFCAYLSDLLFYESPACRGLIDGEYEFVKIDIAKSHQKHNDLARKYGATASTQMEDAPRLTIIDPVADRGLGTLIGKDMLFKPMSMERVFDESKIAPFLESNIAPPRSSGSILDEAVAKAIIQDKAVWVQFTQTGSEQCKAIEAWMDRDDVKPILGKAFVVAKIDVNRTSGGKSMLERFTTTRPAIAPGTVLLTSKGMKLDPPAELDELPRKPEDIKPWVETIQRAAGKKLTAEQITALEQSLKPRSSQTATSDD